MIMPKIEDSLKSEFTEKIEEKNYKLKEYTFKPRESKKCELSLSIPVLYVLIVQSDNFTVRNTSLCEIDIILVVSLPTSGLLHLFRF